MNARAAVQPQEPEFTVLLIECSESDRRIVRQHASRNSGLLILESSEPDEGLRTALSGEVDCVLLNSRFPEGSAFELFAGLLAAPCTQRPPVVLLTAPNDEDAARECLERGAQECLCKSELNAITLRRAIESACKVAALQCEAQAREAQMRRMSFQDPLTSLSNRQLYLDRLEQAVREAARHQRVFGVLSMDLDGFKSINDTYGHAAGDDLLRQVASRLRRVTREADTVARLGGDEFGVLLSTARDREGAMVAAEKLSACFDAPFVVNGRILPMGLSIGMAMFPEHADSAERLLHRAEMAMYTGRRAGRTVTLYGENTGFHAPDGGSLTQGLNAALHNGELFTLFQPQVRLGDGAVTGAEALVRWRHPQLGLLPPTKFIPAAERCDSILALTRMVLAQSLAQARQWQQQGRPLRVSVNLSQRLLDIENLCDYIIPLVREAGVPPERLCLEVTESGMMRSPQTAERTLATLAGAGLRLSIDDFGTGYSSLKYLRHFPIHEIKIDREFVAGLEHDERDSAIVETVLALGRSFGVEVVAEGIESESVWTQLRALGCLHGQGYFIGRPMEPGGFRHWLERWERSSANRPSCCESPSGAALDARDQTAVPLAGPDV